MYRVLAVLAILLAGCGSAAAATQPAFLGVKAYATHVQYPALTTWTPIVFDANEYDSGGFLSSAQPSRITIPVTGYYSLAFAALTDHQVQTSCAFRVNGSGTSTDHTPTAPALSRPIMHRSVWSPAAGAIWCSTTLHLTAGQWVETMVFVYASVAIGHNIAPENMSTLTATYLGS